MNNNILKTEIYNHLKTRIMYYKLTNTDCDIYKKLYSMRAIEFEIEKRNEQAIKDKIPYEWQGFFGNYGQQNFDRVSQYRGFKFLNPEQVDPKIWKRHKIHEQIFIPNTRTKAGKEMQAFLNALEKSCFFTFCDIISFERVGEFSFPYMEIVNEILILYLDAKFEPKDENFIEITKREFEEIRKQLNN